MHHQLLISSVSLAAKALILHVSARVFLEEISIAIHRLSEDVPTTWVGIILSIESLNTTERWKNSEFAFSLCLKWSVDFLCPWTLMCLVLRPLEFD